MLFGRHRRGRTSVENGIPRPTAGAHPFTIVRNGYSTNEVAAFLTEMSSDTSVLRPQDLKRITFQVARRGYDKAEVLAYLNRVTAELEAELTEARSKLRRKRLANIDPSLVDTFESDGLTDHAHAPRRTQAISPGYSGPADTEPDIEVFEVERPNAPLSPSTESAAEMFEVKRPAQEAPPAPTVREASDQIADLLRESHDHAIRLRSQAEADVRSTVDAAQAEIDQRRRNQVRELGEQRHRAEMEAMQLVSAAQMEADTVKAAAQAVLTQAKAEIDAVKALAAHNLVEIEAARARTINDSREMLSLGRGMLQSVVDIDQRCAARLEQSDDRVRELLGDGAI